MKRKILNYVKILGSHANVNVSFLRGWHDILRKCFKRNSRHQSRVGYGYPVFLNLGRGQRLELEATAQINQREQNLKPTWLGDFGADYESEIFGSISVEIHPVFIEAIGYFLIFGPIPCTCIN